MLDVEGRSQARITALNRALEIAEAADATALIPRILPEIAYDAFIRGQVEEGLAALERGWALVRAAQDGPALVTLAAQESDALLKLARFQRAAEVVSRGLAAARQAGLQSWDQADFLAANAAEALLALGRTGQAAALIDPLTTGLPDRDHRRAHTARAEIDLLRGDPGAAADRWQLLHSLPAPGWVYFAWETARRAAEAALWTGRPGDALDKVQRVLPLVKTPDLTILCGRLLTAGMWACADLAGQARARRDQPGAAAAAAAAAVLATWVQQVCGAPFADHPYLAAIPAELATWDAERTRLAGPGTGQPRRRARSRGHVRRRLRRRCDDPLADARGDPGDAGRALPGDPGSCAESGVLWKIGGCDGGAAWLPPGLAGRFAEVEQSTRAAVSSLTGDGGARYAAFWDWLDAHLPGEPCWFLDLVGVAPAAQGRGLGRALVRHGLQRARADGCPAFLETGTPRNVSFYESLGFQVIGEQQAPDAGPVIWFMQTPRTARS